MTAARAPPPPLEPAQLKRNDQIDRARGGQILQFADIVRLCAELGPPVNDGDAFGDTGQVQRPVDGAIPAACDDDPFAAEIFDPRDHVMHAQARAFVLEFADTVERRAVGPEGPDPGGDDHRRGLDFRACRRGDAPSIVPFHQARDRAAQVIDGIEGGGLLLQPRHQVLGVDLGITRNIEDGFFRIKRAELSARHVQGIDDMAFQAQHAALEHREQADRTGADDDDIR